MTRHLLLLVHIAAAAAWLGANFVQLTVGKRMLGQPDETAARWAETTGRLVATYYNVAGTLLGVTGVLLVLDGDWAWSSGFVAVGITALVIGGVLGVVEFGPQSKKIAAAARAGDGPTFARLVRRNAMAAVFDTLVVLTTILAMVDKWRVG